MMLLAWLLLSLATVNAQQAEWHDSLAAVNGQHHSRPVFSDRRWRIDDVLLSSQTTARLLNRRSDQVVPPERPANALLAQSSLLDRTTAHLLNQPLVIGSDQVVPPERPANALLAQSSCSVEHPTDLAATQVSVSLELAGMAMLGRRPTEVAIIGTGAGCLLRMLQAFTGPACHVVGVDNDIEVVRLGARWYQSDSSHVAVQDGARWLAKAVESGQHKIDTLVMDTYSTTNPGQIPPVFYSEHFLSNAFKALRADGVLVTNYCLAEQFCLPFNPPILEYVHQLQAVGFQEVITLDDGLGSSVVIGLKVPGLHVDRKTLLEKVSSWHNSVRDPEHTNLHSLYQLIRDVNFNSFGTKVTPKSNRTHHTANHTEIHHHNFDNTITTTVIAEGNSSAVNSSTL